MIIKILTVFMNGFFIRYNNTKKNTLSMRKNIMII